MALPQQLNPSTEDVVEILLLELSADVMLDRNLMWSRNGMQL